MSKSVIKIESNVLPTIVIEYGNEDVLGAFITVFVYEPKFEKTDFAALNIDTLFGIWDEDIEHIPYVLSLLDKIDNEVVNNIKNSIFTKYMLETKHRKN